MAKVLIVGLDGATWRLFQPWVDAGRLPNLQALMARGSWGPLRSTVPAITLPAWASFMTGKNPGAHGIFAFRRLANDRYESRGIANAGDLRSATMWDIAGRADRQVGVINVPPSYPLRRVNGFIVGCMLTPPGETRFTEPPEVAAELGDYRIDVEVPRGLTPGSPDYLERSLAYAAALEEQTTLRAAATERLMTRRPWDLLSVVFYGADRVQHFFWPEAEDGRGDPRLIAAVRRVYDALDAALGRLVLAAGPDATALVVSDHGFGPAPRRLVRINRWLVDQGLLARRAFWPLRRRVVRKWLPASLRARYDSDEHIMLNRARTRAWCEPMDSPSEAGVWVHVRGRYPLGCVEPGAEYEAVRQWIVDGLRELRDDDGRSVFRGVWRREDLYHGPFVREAPDVVVQTNADFAVSLQAMRADLKAPSTIEAYESTAFNGHSGAHDPDGLYVLAGPPAAALGERQRYPIEAIAPTALHLLSVPVPRDIEGPVLVDLLDPAWMATHPVAYTEQSEAPPPLAGEWGSDADEAVIADRLRSLGYLG